MIPRHASPSRPPSSQSLTAWSQMIHFKCTHVMKAIPFYNAIISLCNWHLNRLCVAPDHSAHISFNESVEVKFSISRYLHSKYGRSPTISPLFTAGWCWLNPVMQRPSATRRPGSRHDKPPVHTGDTTWFPWCWCQIRTSPHQAQSPPPPRASRTHTPPVLSLPSKSTLYALFSLHWFSDLHPINLYLPLSVFFNFYFKVSECKIQVQWW